MKLLPFLALLLLVCSCHTPHSATLSVKPDGVWVPVRQELGGKEMPPSFYQVQKLTISGNQYTLSAESVDKGEVKTDGDKMDIYGKEGVNKDKHFTAIWKMENGQLIICYNLKGDLYPDAYSTTGHPLYFLSVFKREN